MESGVAFLSGCGSNSILVRSPLECRSAGRGRGASARFGVHRVGADEFVVPVTSVCTAPVPDAGTSHHVCGDRGASASRVRSTCGNGTVRCPNAGSVCDAIVTSAVGAARVLVEGYTPALTVFVAAARHASVGCGVAVRWSPAVSSLPVPMRILTPVPGG